MQFFTVQDARSFAQANTNQFKTAQKILKEQADTYSQYKTYDVFLSHAFSDAELVLGVKKIMENEGFSVYVDWIEDPNLDRNNVTKEVADHIRQRMKSCRNLIYAASNNASKSHWMPWELGYFDGHKPGNVYIMPLLERGSDGFKGREYLSLYPVLGRRLPADIIGSSLQRGFQVLDGTFTRHLRSAA